MGDTELSTVIQITGSSAISLETGLSWIYDRFGTDESDLDTMNAALNPTTDAVYIRLNARTAIDDRGYPHDAQFTSQAATSVPSPSSLIDTNLLAGGMAVCYDYHENSEQYETGMNQYFSVSTNGAPMLSFQPGVGPNSTTPIDAPESGGWFEDQYTGDQGQSSYISTVVYKGDEEAALRDKFGWGAGTTTSEYVASAVEAMALDVHTSGLRQGFVYNTVSGKRLSLKSVSIFPRKRVTGSTSTTSPASIPMASDPYTS
jgi:hypothetical protein